MARSSSKYWSHDQAFFLLLTAPIEKHSHKYKAHGIKCAEVLGSNWMEQEHLL